MTGSGDNGGCLFPVPRASLFPWRASLACAAFPTCLRNIFPPPAQNFPPAVRYVVSMGECMQREAQGETAEGKGGGKETFLSLMFAYLGFSS
jgi:hypothetical protein